MAKTTTIGGRTTIEIKQKLVDLANHLDRSETWVLQDLVEKEWERTFLPPEKNHQGQSRALIAN